MQRAASNTISNDNNDDIFSNAQNIQQLVVVFERKKQDLLNKKQDKLNERENLKQILQATKELVIQEY